MADWWTPYIQQHAAKYGLDPAAVLAVAKVEGLSGKPGDNNTSWGPFQLHVGGALPAGKDRAWAESPEGIDYALREIGKVAHGLTGTKAIAAIVTHFERPAAPGAEIANASQAMGAAPGITTLPALPTSSAAVDTGTATPAEYRKASAISGLQDIVSGHYNPLSVLQAMAVAKTAVPAAPPAGVGVGVQAQTAAPTDQKPSDWVTISPTADRQGVKTNPTVIDFVAKIAQGYGSKLTIGTGSNHHEYVSGEGKTISDHWYGEAADIPMSGDALTRLGQDALIAAGMPPAEARKQKGGVYNVGGYNILFNTKVGGNHFNHLHVGLGRILGRKS